MNQYLISLDSISEDLPLNIVLQVTCKNNLPQNYFNHHQHSMKGFGYGYFCDRRINICVADNNMSKGIRYPLVVVTISFVRDTVRTHRPL